MRSFLFLFAMIALFLVAGPPVGAIAFSLIGSAGALVFDPTPGTAGMIFYGGLVSIVLSWLIGGVQAALTGAITALYAIRTGRLSMPVAMMAGVVTGVGYIWNEDLAPIFIALLVAVHLAAAIACTALALAVWGQHPAMLAKNMPAGDQP